LCRLAARLVANGLPVDEPSFSNFLTNDDHETRRNAKGTKPRKSFV
jgi:hypothetical protein